MWQVLSALEGLEASGGGGGGGVMLSRAIRTLHSDTTGINKP